MGREWEYRAPWASQESQLGKDEYELWQRAIAECMVSAGFDYTPYKYFDTGNLFSELNPLNESALSLGYEDPPQQLPQGSPSPNFSSPAYQEAIGGARGCGNRAQHFVYDAPFASTATKLLDTLGASADRAVEGYGETADAQRRLRSWASCMASAGFRFSSPDAARLKQGGDGVVSKEELTVRQADFRCDVATELTESRSKFETAAFSAWLDHNALSVRQLTDLESQAAQELVGLKARLANEHAAALPDTGSSGDTTASTLPK